jgi:4-hydroxy-3-methylbut-2-enyl diphosphate reductase
MSENMEMNMHDLMDEIEKSLRLPRGGEVVTGKVHQVTEKEIIVNLGCKKDGIIPSDEITLEGDQKLTDLYKEGDEIQAKVVKTDDGDGSILLSKKKLEVGEHWDEISKALEEKATIEVKVVRPVNGGVIAAYKEVSGFIPLSQLSDKYVENAEEFVGQTLEVKVSRVDQKRQKAVFSHKMFLNDEKNKKIAEIWEGLSVDDVVEGTVMRFTDYGAFVDIGGIDGLLHISEISWGKLKHPQEVLSIGEVIRVKVLSMNAEKGKISLGLKQNQPEPWSVINEKYEIGQVVAGKVVQIKEYGAFVELEPGLDGLVHISEVAHKRVGNIAEELTVGQEVSAKILEIDQERKRISLSIKETLEAPVAEEAPAEETADEE